MWAVQAASHSCMQAVHPNLPTVAGEMWIQVSYRELQCFNWTPKWFKTSYIQFCFLLVYRSTSPSLYGGQHKIWFRECLQVYDNRYCIRSLPAWGEFEFGTCSYTDGWNSWTAFLHLIRTLIVSSFTNPDSLNVYIMYFHWGVILSHQFSPPILTGTQIQASEASKATCIANSSMYPSYIRSTRYERVYKQ